MSYPRFVRNLLLWLIPVLLLWLALTPIYNRLLTATTHHLVRLGESPSVTRLYPRETHYFVITRTDLRPPAGKAFLTSVRITDTHFPVVFLATLFLAVPGVPMKKKLARLVLALLIAALFHVVSLVFWVQFVYTTQLGNWSTEHYGAFARNFWGLGKHLLDLPFKLALPLMLWAGSFLGEILPGADEGG